MQDGDEVMEQFDNVDNVRDVSQEEKKGKEEGEGDEMDAERENASDKDEFMLTPSSSSAPVTATAMIDFGGVINVF